MDTVPLKIKGSKQKKSFKDGNLEGNPDLSILGVLFQTTGPGSEGQLFLA